MKMKIEKEHGSEPVFIKSRSGGLMDVEFCTQFLQLLWGWKYPSIRKRSTLGALVRMRKVGILGEEKFKDLRDGYLFLRHVESRPRILFDLPLSKVPEDKSQLGMLAKALGFSDTSSFVERFYEVSRKNRCIFEAVLTGET